MKKILLLSTMIAGSLFAVTNANAQFNVSVNIGMQPAWGPTGYDYAEYYYLPDVEAYYSVASRQFVYFDRGNWVYSSSLPGRCGNYDLYSGYKVVLNERDPWCHFNDHRARYAGYRFRHDQVVIRDRGDYGRGGYYGRPGYDDRSRGRDWGYSNRGNERRGGYDNDRRERGRDDDRRGGGYERERRHDNDHEDRGRGHGRW